MSPAELLREDWQISQAGRSPSDPVMVLDREGRHIATFYGPDAPQRAKLATAAPDLVDAACAAADYLDGRSDVVDGDYGEPAPNEAMSLLRTVDAALRKAGWAP